MDEPEQPSGESGGKSRRGPGKRAIDPNEYDRIGDMRAKGVPYHEIAALYDCDPKTIRNIFNKEVLPAVKTSPSRSIEAELHRLQALERVAWQKLMSNAPCESRERMKEDLKNGGQSANGNTIELSGKVIERTVDKITGRGQQAWAKLILEIIQTRCQMEGHYAPKRFKVETTEEYRVAGMTPDQMMEEQLLRIEQRIEEVKLREARLRGEIVIVDAEIIDDNGGGPEP